MSTHYHVHPIFAPLLNAIHPHHEPTPQHDCREHVIFVRDLMAEDDSLWRCEVCSSQYTARELAAWEDPL